MIGSFFNPFVNKIIPSYKVSICIVCFLLPTAESDNFKLLGLKISPWTVNGPRAALWTPLP